MDMLRSDVSNSKYDAGWSMRFGKDTRAQGRAARVMTYGRRARIIDEGDQTTNTYEIIEGGVILFKLLPDGRRQIIEVLGVGDVFGPAPNSISDVGAEALTPARIAVHERRAVIHDVELRDRLFARLRAQMCALHDHTLLLGRKSANERVATFIMRLVPDRGGAGCVGPAAGPAQIGLAMTRQEIADYLGLTIETVSRAFSSLRRKGVITYSKQDEIAVPDVCRLCRLSGSQ